MKEKSQIRRVIEGLSILERYDPKGCVTAEHDQVWAGHPRGYERPLPVSAEDAAALEALGWDYDDGVGWSTFV